MKGIKFFFTFLVSFTYVDVLFSTDRNYDIEYSYVEGLRNKYLGNYSNSAYIFNSIIKVDSTCGACNYELARLYFNAGTYDMALNYAQKAYFLDTTNYWYLHFYSDLLLSTSDTASALPLVARLIHFPEADDDDRLNFSKLALFYPSYYSEGKKVLSSLLPSLPVGDVYYVSFLYRYVGNEPYHRLLSFVDSCITLFPDDENFLLAKVRLLASHGKFKFCRSFLNPLLDYSLHGYDFDALRTYCSLFHRRSDVVFVHFYLNHFFSDTIDLSIKTIWLKNLFSTSCSSFKSYLSTSLLSLLDTIAFPSSIYDLSFDFYASNSNFENALSVASKYVQFYPDNITSWGRYVYALFGLQRFDSISNLIKTRTDAFASPIGLYIAGFVSYQNKSYDTARVFLSRCLNTKGNFGFKTIAVNLLGDYYYSHNKADSAFYYYERSIVEGYADEIIMNNYAYYLAEKGLSLSRAEILSRTAILKYPKNASFLDTYAWVLFKLHRYSEALVYIKSALKYADSINSDLADHYAAILFCSGNKDKAIKFLRKYYSPDLFVEKIKLLVCE
jgi:tetratricopeptide (TPR) repeat protein